MRKTCFKCNTTKELTDFYAHPRMKDGHLNKCIDCTKKDTSERLLVKMNDPVFVESEKKRGRLKYHKYKYKPDSSLKRVAQSKWIDKYPEKRLAHGAAQHMSIPGMECHHWSYREEHRKDIIHLSVKDHYKAHRFIIYDQEQMMYRRYDNMELLDTKDRHLGFIQWCIENLED